MVNWSPPDWIQHLVSRGISVILQLKLSRLGLIIKQPYPYLNFSIYVIRVTLAFCSYFNFYAYIFFLRIKFLLAIWKTSLQNMVTLSFLCRLTTVLFLLWPPLLHRTNISLSPMFHLANLSLHILTVILLYLTCHLALPAVTSFPAAAIFALHPTHS